MHPWVAILGFLLLLPDGVTSYRQVIGVEGQSVTLPCFYEGKVTSICWGRGRCSWIDCRNTVISTDGYKVTEQKNERYKLKGDIGKRDVSLTIENAVLSDSGLYCCRIIKWLFNDGENIIKLTIKSAPPTTTVSPTTTSESTSESTSTTNIPRTTYTTAPKRKTTIPERNSTTTVVTDTHTTTGASTSALLMPTPTEDYKPAPPTTTVSPTTTSESTSESTSTTNIPRTTYTTAPKRKTTIPERNSTTAVVTDTRTTTGASTSALPMPTPTEDHKPASSSSPTQTTRTRSTCPHKTNVTHSPWHSTTSGGNNTVINLPSAVCCSIQTGIYIGISVIVLILLLMVVVFMISKRSVCLGNKMRLLCMVPLKESHIGALKNAAMKPVRAEDNIYVMEDIL